MPDRIECFANQTRIHKHIEGRTYQLCTPTHLVCKDNNIGDLSHPSCGRTGSGMCSQSQAYNTLSCMSFFTVSTYNIVVINGIQIWVCDTIKSETIEKFYRRHHSSNVCQKWQAGNTNVRCHISCLSNGYTKRDIGSGRANTGIWKVIAAISSAICFCPITLFLVEFKYNVANKN